MRVQFLTAAPRLIVCSINRDLPACAARWPKGHPASNANGMASCSRGTRPPCGTAGLPAAVAPAKFQKIPTLDFMCTKVYYFHHELEHPPRNSRATIAAALAADGAREPAFRRRESEFLQRSGGDRRPASFGNFASGDDRRVDYGKGRFRRRAAGAAD